MPKKIEQKKPVNDKYKKDSPVQKQTNPNGEPRRGRGYSIKRDGLTDKHMFFCKRYVLNGGNASKASRESGFDQWYGVNTLIKESRIQEEIQRYRAERAKKFEVTADRIIAELTRVAFGTLGDFLKIMPDGTPVIDCQEIGEEEMAALSEVTQDVYYERTGVGEEDVEPVKKTKIKLHNKVQALDQLARIFNLYKEFGNSDSPEEKAAKIRAMVKAMNEVDSVKEQ
jgi:phage terminase small subunit